MLEISLGYGNVLYCMDNETNESPEWGAYWSLYIQQKAQERGVTAYTTEMWDWDHDTRPYLWGGKNHPHTMSHPEIYSFIDISQNNSSSDQFHWDNIQWARKYIARQPRPIHTIKIYGGERVVGYTLTGEQAVERFWRNIIGGFAGTRFHRPPSGIGLKPQAQASIRSMRMLLAELDIVNCIPDVDSAQLSNRGDDEAYLTYIPGEQYAVYFPDGGYVRLELPNVTGTFSLKWLDVAKSEWSESTTTKAEWRTRLLAPGSRNWVALLTRVNE